MKIVVVSILLIGLGLVTAEEKETTIDGNVDFIALLEAEFEKEIIEDKTLTEDEKKEMRDYIAYLKEREKWPKSLAEAVKEIISTMPEENVPIILETSKEELSKFHHSWGQGIRNAFGLWRGNHELIHSACGEACHPDTASMKIIEAVWTELQNNIQ